MKVAKSARANAFRRGALMLPPTVRRALVAHARRARPRECCGLLVGRGRRVAFAVPMRNVARGRTRYRVDPAAHLALQRVVRAFFPPAAIIGVYHSHPAGVARPSATDIAQAHYRDWIYVIVGLAAGRAQVAAFRIGGSRVRPMTIERTPG